MFTHKDDTLDDIKPNQTGPVDLSPSDNILHDIVEGDAEILQNLPDEPVLEKSEENQSYPTEEKPIPENLEQESV